MPFIVKQSNTGTCGIENAYGIHIVAFELTFIDPLPPKQEENRCYGPMVFDEHYTECGLSAGGGGGGWGGACRERKGRSLVWDAISGKCLFHVIDISFDNAVA